MTAERKRTKSRKLLLLPDDHMMKKLFNLFKTYFQKYREQLMYLIFGVLTTLVNLIVYRICTVVLPPNQIVFVVFPWWAVSNVVSWIASVTFAFFTNRAFVFQSKAKGAAGHLYEFFSFYACRLFSLGVEFLMMFVMVSLLTLNDFFSKIITNIVVIILNYFGSKLIVFRNKKK